MKKLAHISLLFVLMIAVLAACSDSPTNAEADEINDEETVILQGIIGEALSDKHEGFMASIYDITAGISEAGLLSRDNDNRDWRGPMNNYHHNFNPETGIHSIMYRRSMTRPNFSNYMAVRLNYLFLDEAGDFIVRPNVDRDLIETISFDGQRIGFTHGPVRESDFRRNAEWLLEGFGPSNDTMSLSGIQSTAGEMRFNRPNGTTGSRLHTTRFQLVDISIQKPSREDESMEYLVTGTIEYEISVTRERNGEEVTNEYSGTIELDGSGTALMRIMGLDRVIRFQLRTGEIVS